MLSNEDYMKIFHEIKNSVTLINSYLQLAEKKHPEIAGFDYWNLSKNEVTRLRTIVTELSHVKLGSHLKKEPMDIRTFISYCCDSYQSDTSEPGITCTLLQPKEPLIALIDPNLLYHAISNLLKNSCEAMCHQGNIQISSCLEEDEVLIRLIDCGGGIAPDIMENIFEPFHTTKENGSGLGMNIARQIIEAHHGSISVDSRLGDGCTFLIHLPAGCE